MLPLYLIVSGINFWSTLLAAVLPRISIFKHESLKELLNSAIVSLNNLFDLAVNFLPVGDTV
jgi:hypothetical protein